MLAISEGTIVALIGMAATLATAVTVALITGRFALRAARASEATEKATATSNGHSMGQLAEEDHERIGEIAMKLDEHLKNHEAEWVSR